MPEKYQMERILAALKALTTVGYIKRESLMEECRISSRTFDRFIADLKLYVPVIYDDVKNRYVIDRTKANQRTEMLEYYKKVMIKDDFLLFYAFVRSMIKSKYFFPPFSTEYGTSSQPRDFAKVLKMLEDLVSPVDKKIYDKVEYFLSGHYHFRNRPHYKDVCERIWYMIAYLVESSKVPEEECNVVRTYKIAYIKNSELVKGEFYPVHEEEPEYSFQNSFGIYMDEALKRAVINIYGHAAHDAMEIVWHQDQFTRDLKDGDGNKFTQISLDYPEKGGVELMSRVLSFGTNAEIVSPPELKAQWQNEINAMGKKFLKE